MDALTTSTANAKRAFAASTVYIGWIYADRDFNGDRVGYTAPTGCLLSPFAIAM